MPDRSTQKRIFDLIVASTVTVLALPVGATAALAILLDDGRPILFKQERIGRGGEVFTIYKFRTMSRSTPNVPSAVATDVEITRVGRTLRRLSVDELPQLINIFAGHMSVVGPRPALPSQEDVLQARKAAGVEAVAPGVTGLAQVSSYDGMSTNEKVSFDAQYAANHTLGLDLKILARTILYLKHDPPRY